MTTGENQTPNTASRPLSGIAVAAFIIGIAAVLLTFTTVKLFAPFVLVGGLVAVVLGAVSDTSMRTSNRAGVWYARIGILLGAAAFILNIVWLSR